MNTLKGWSSSLLLGAALVNGCAPLAEDMDIDTQEIVGGTTAATGEFPFATHLRIGSSVCGGSLVSPTLVLTAAHCVAGQAPSAITATIGRTRLSNTATGEVRGVSEVIVHPNYNASTRDYDVAFVRLSAPSTRAVVQVASPSGPSERALWQAGANVTAIGWGRLSEGGSLSDNLMKVDLPVLSDTVASASAVHGTRFHPDTMLAAGPLAGGRDACEGDRGGPLLARGASGLRVVGVTSWGVGCARSNKPGVYTRVAAQKIHRWVKSVLHETPLVGDVNGDLRADIVTCTHGAASDVIVALSDGTNFGTASRWHDWFAQNGVIPALGDFNGDGRDDLWAVNPDSVWVATARAVGSGGGDFMGPGYSRIGIARPSDIPRVGDVDGNGRADLVLFTADANADVYVALATPTGLDAPRPWHGDFAREGHTPILADVDGDGKKDIVSFDQGVDGATTVRVALSNGMRFGTSVTVGHTYFGIATETPGAGFFNRDTSRRYEDIVTFLRNGTGDVYVGLSNGATFSTGAPWRSGFGTPTSALLTGDVNGDGLTDILKFTQDSAADVFVSRSSGATFLAPYRAHDYFAP